MLQYNIEVPNVVVVPLLIVRSELGPSVTLPQLTEEGHQAQWSPVLVVEGSGGSPGPGQLVLGAAEEPEIVVFERTLEKDIRLPSVVPGPAAGLRGVVAHQSVCLHNTYAINVLDRREQVPHLAILPLLSDLASFGHAISVPCRRAVLKHVLNNDHRRSQQRVVKIANQLFHPLHNVRPRLKFQWLAVVDDSHGGSVREPRKDLVNPTQ